MRDFAWLFCLAACSLTTAVSAQAAPSAEPDAVQRALREERELSRLTLSDAWLTHLDREEHDSLKLQRWVFGGLFGLSAVGWSVGVVANEVDEGSRAASIAMGGAAAVSLGLLVAQAALADDYEASAVARWGTYAELVGGGSALVAMSQSEGCNEDCPLFTTLLGAGIITQGVFLALADLIHPPFYLSRYRERYLAKPAAERAAYGLDLMLERESHQRTASYLLYSLATLQATLYGVGAFEAENDASRGIFAVLAASTFLTASVNLIVQLLERTPSDKLAAGLPPPPAPNAF